MLAWQLSLPEGADEPLSRTAERARIGKCAFLRAKRELKKRPDLVDGLVALTALEIGAALVATSDPDDIRAYLGQLPGAESVIPLRV
ncbi:hypothetical protein STSP_35110 [Streptomyces jeddahensis]|uniref:PIN domain-containing protein n=2 Tax=Streptomyces jeddahensis TaxID=1716141 RepID=A0A177HR34_9ACTN|nr:hypothetical protein STSP_35110 [Streptomyces jeddahensis]